MCTVERREYLLIGVSADGFASLLDVATGKIDASLPLPPPVHLRRNTKEEEDAYAALVGLRGSLALCALTPASMPTPTPSTLALFAHRVQIKSVADGVDGSEASEVYVTVVSAMGLTAIMPARALAPTA